MRIQEGLYDKGIFKAIIIVGGPGSGKSFVSNKLSEGLPLNKVNIDSVFEFLHKKHNQDINYTSDTGKHLYQKSRKIIASKMNSFINGRLGLIIDTTGQNTVKLEQVKKELELEGYEVRIVIVKADLEVAIKRNQERNRKVDINYLLYVFQKMKKIHQSILTTFQPEHIIVINNNEDQDLSSIWKKIRNWVHTPVDNPRANVWMQTQRKQKIKWS